MTAPEPKTPLDRATAMKNTTTPSVIASLLKAKKTYYESVGVFPTHVTMTSKTKRQLEDIFELEGMSFKHPDYFEDHVFGMSIVVDDSAKEVHVEAKP